MDFLTERAVIGTYFERLQAGDTSWINKTAVTIPSNQAIETLAWLDMTPRMRKMEGGRKAVELGDTKITIANDEYEATLDFKQSDLRRDKSGQALERVRELADGKLDMYMDNVTTLLVNGASTACYDSQYFFDTDHSEGTSGTQSNSITVDISAMPAQVHGSTTAPSAKEMQIAILKGVQQIIGLRDDKNRAFNSTAREFLVIVPTAFTYAALEAITLPTIDFGNTNLITASNKFSIDVAFDPYLDGTWSDTFAVLRTDTVTRPFIITEEAPIEMTMKWLNSEYYHDNHRVQVGTYTSCGFGYGRWQNACQVQLV